MVTYGPWTTYSGIRQSVGQAGPAINWLPSPYNSQPTGPYSGSGSNRYAISQSFEAYQNLQMPHEDLGARLCAQAHVKELDPVSSFVGWDPGQCLALPTVSPVTQVPPVPSGDAHAVLSVGTQTSWQGPPLYLLPAVFEIRQFSAHFGIGYVPFWVATGTTRDPRQECSTYIYRQIPGWLDSMAARLEPEVEVLRVDGEASMSQIGGSFTVNGHTMPGSNRVIGTPYSALGSVGLSAGAGGSSATLTFPNMSVGEFHGWNLSSARELANLDPGPADNFVAQVQISIDFVYQVRVRFPIDPVVDVCRWRQRDDGLGVTAAARARTGTSLQRGHRHRGYR